MNKRFIPALIAYAILLTCSCFLLQGIARKAVLILFAGLIVKTVIAWKARW